MLKPYRKIKETEEYITYEFKTLYLYLMYGTLVLLAIGYFTDIFLLMGLGGFLMLLYLLVVTTQYYPLCNKIKKASKASSVEISGSKFSFSNPLRVKIKKEFI